MEKKDFDILGFAEVEHHKVGDDDYYEYHFKDFGYWCLIKGGLDELGLGEFVIEKQKLDNPNKKRWQAVSNWFEQECENIERLDRTTYTR